MKAIGLALLLIAVKGYAGTSNIFLDARDGKAMANNQLEACGSSDCKAIISLDEKLCDFGDCVAIVSQHEAWCMSWDCKVLVHAANSGAGEQLSYLCISPNCRAILAHNPALAENFDRIFMEDAAREPLESILKKWPSDKVNFWTFYYSYREEFFAKIQRTIDQLPKVTGFPCLHDLPRRP